MRQELIARLRLFFVLPLVMLGGGVAGQGPEWANAATPHPNFPRAGVAYDEGRGCIVAFGSGTNETWEFDGVCWRQRTPSVSPPATFDPAVVYDRSRGKIVMIGGRTSSGELNETWEWDGVNWSQIANAPSLAGPLVTLKRIAVWHGGANPGLLCNGVSGFSSQTWRLVGSTWTLVQNGGFGSWLHVPLNGLTYGANSPGVDEVWDGTTWSPVTSNWPAMHTMLSLGWDPSRNQFVAVSTTNNTDSWTQFGTLVGTNHIQWSTVSNFDIATNAYVPPGSWFAHQVFDAARSRMVHLFGWISSSQVLDGHYELQPPGAPSPWKYVATPTLFPSSRTYADQSYEPGLGRTVLFGGVAPGTSSALGDTWSFDGRQWTNHGSNLGASARVLPRLAHLSGQGTVLFGGATSIGGTFLDDTLAWNGSTWTTLFSFVRPSPRYGHDLASVGNGASVWLFGGYGGSYLNDTWRLGGSGWQQVGTFGPTPPARSSHRLAYDQRRGRLVLFGGQGVGASFLGDTWELTLGASPTWMQTTPAGSPTARWNHAMDYDPARGLVVMTGGYGPPPAGGSAQFHNDVWEYDGTTWRQRTPTGPLPSAREAAGFSWHAPLQRFVLQGGYSPTLPYGPTETFFYRAPIDVPGPGMVSNAFPLRTRTFPVAGQTLTLDFPNPSTFGWLLVQDGPDHVGLPLFPDPLFCGAGRVYGANGVLADAMGNPGVTSFALPLALLGRAITCQGVALTTSLCFAFSNPLVLTVTGS